MIKIKEEYKSYKIVLNTKTKRYSIRGTEWPHSLKKFVNLEIAKRYIDKELT